ncbi:MAG: hypothetical protein IJ608_11440 [Lachnospiraceae bacterium]|nr:hypothetical protein [Lachnospiraceae bacterium]
MEKLCLMIYLCILSMLDIKEKKIPVAAIVFGLLGALMYRVTVGLRADTAICVIILEIFLGILPGLLLLVIALLSHKAGSADGPVIMVPGILLGYRVAVEVLCMSIFLISVFSIVLLIIRRVDKNTKLPYIPFAAVSLMIGGLIM